MLYIIYNKYKNNKQVILCTCNHVSLIYPYIPRHINYNVSNPRLCGGRYRNFICAFCILYEVIIQSWGDNKLQKRETVV